MKKKSSDTKNFIIMKKLYLILILSFFFIGSVNILLNAQPANDDICSATSIAINGGGQCITGDSNIAATPDYYGGCVSSGNLSVWYTFSLVGGNNMAEFTVFTNTFPAGTVVEMFLFDSTCSVPAGLSTVCDDADTAIFQFWQLSSGVTYWLMVSTDPANVGTFDICGAGDAKNVVNGPEQDCSGAIKVCDYIYDQSISYGGPGDINDINGTCLLSNETNSVWYVFTVQANGSLEFLINTSQDYDFALYDITTIGCAGVPGATPDRCNWSGTKGNTGLVLPTSATIPLSEPATGPNTMPGMDITAGQTFALLVDNWSGSAAGYTLDFGSSPIVDVTSPTMVTVTPDCDGNDILINYIDEDILCLSIVQGDFTLFNNTTSTDYSGAITEILGNNCPITDGAVTNQINISHDGTLPPGNYTITIGATPSLQDKCGNVIAPGATISFDYFPPVSLTLTSDVSEICNSGDAVVLTATGAPAGETYTLTPGPISNTTGIFNVNPTVTQNYNVAVTFGGCTQTANTTVILIGTVVVTIDPVDPQICSGTANLNASATINGVNCSGCTFLWSTAETTPTITVPPGPYTVNATTAAPGLCPSSNTASSTVSLASAGGTGSCNVWYVSPGGGGDGKLRTTPTTLQAALDSALCTSAIVKMQTGTYTFSAPVFVNSYIIIEGGFSADFSTKSSDMLSGSATTIVRSGSADPGSLEKKFSAFKVISNSDAFEFHDLRIELPTNHAAGSEITNYGIYLSGACTNYKIIRCYIDAGAGADTN